MSRPAFSFLLCPDSQLLRNRLDSLLAAHPPAGSGTWQRHVFWGDEGLPPAFWEHLTLQGLFATPKALIIRNAQTVPAETLKTLSQALLPMAGTRAEASLTWPLICLEVGFDRGKPKIPPHIQRLAAYTAAEQRQWLDATPGLTEKSMPVFIRTEADKQGIVLRADEIAMLSQSLPPDAAFISSELAKLALSVDGSGRLPENAFELIGHSPELGIFELMRSVQQNQNAPAAWRQILRDRLSGENMVFAFTAILLREARMLWQSLSGTPAALPPHIAVQKKIAAQALGVPGIARLWELALQADKGIKSGERNPEQAFEILVADLCLLFGGNRGG